jgi:hypothetical protein
MRPAHSKAASGSLSSPGDGGGPAYERPSFPLLAILFAEFDNTVGPKITCQAPEGSDDAQQRRNKTAQHSEQRTWTSAACVVHGASDSRSCVALSALPFLSAAAFDSVMCPTSCSKRSAIS